MSTDWNELAAMVRDHFGVPLAGLDADVAAACVDVVRHQVEVEVGASNAEGASLRARALAWIREELPGAEEEQPLADLVPEPGRVARLESLQVIWGLAKGTLVEPSGWSRVGCLVPFLALLAYLVGRRLCPVPFELGRILAAIAVALAAGATGWAVDSTTENTGLVASIALRAALFALFVAIVLGPLLRHEEREQLRRIARGAWQRVTGSA